MAIKPTLNEAVAHRLTQLASIAESGVTERVGRVKRDEHGEAIGRMRGGFRKMFPELSSRDTPKTVAASIRRGKGKVFRRIESSVRKEMRKAGYKDRTRRGPSRPIGPHAGNRKCSHCRGPHTTSQHRFHGPGAFNQTHLFGFNPKGRALKNPKTSGVRIYGEVLSIMARKTGKHQCDAECQRLNHRYVHEFKTKPEMIGLTNGDILIRSRR